MNLKDLINDWLNTNGYNGNWWLRIGIISWPNGGIQNWELRQHETHYYYYVMDDSVECGCEYPESIKASDPQFFNQLKKLVEDPKSYTCNRGERPTPHPWIF